MCLDERATQGPAVIAVPRLAGRVPHACSSRANLAGRPALSRCASHPLDSRPLGRSP